MNIAKLTTLHPKRMTIRHGLLALAPIQAREAQIHINNAHLLVNNIASVGDDNRRRQAQTTSILFHPATARVGAALQSRTGGAPRNHDALILEAVEVGVARSLDDGATVALRGRDRIPVLHRVPVEIARGVECPVAFVSDDGVDGRDFAVREQHARGDHIGVWVGCGDQLGEGGTCGGVVDAPAVIDPEGLAKDTGCVDVQGLVVLGILHCVGESGKSRALAVGLCRDVLVGYAFEVFAAALTGNGQCE